MYKNLLLSDPEKAALAQTELKAAKASHRRLIRNSDSVENVALFVKGWSEHELRAGSFQRGDYR